MEQLLKLPYDDIKSVTIHENEEFMRTPLKEIYSKNKIRPQYTDQPKDNNESLIKKIYKISIIIMIIAKFIKLNIYGILLYLYCGS